VFSVVCRSRYIVRNVVPIITCSPWNPVATKTAEPYAESATVNGALKCSTVKYNPNSTVKNSP
jgi:hypothetical protein